MNPQLFEELTDKAHWVRTKVVEMAVHAKSGHISSAFSQTEMLVSLYQGGILHVNPANPKWEGRDRFILSRGQGGIGFYPVLADMGFFPLSELENFAGEGNLLGVHAESHIPGMEILSGSLGHGLPIACGMAHVGLEKKKDWLVFCYMGDAELYEGSNWEAAFYAGGKRLSNLVCIVDRNGQGVTGFTEGDELSSDGPHLNPLDEKFAAFGFEVRVIDGHSLEEIFEAFADIRERQGKPPLMIIANTVKGKGASVMENQRLWHYRVPTGEDLESLRKDLDMLPAPALRHVSAY